jgi:hypothetical protein
MPAKEIYEYAVIRLVPRVEREEFLNVGVIVFCKQKDFLQVKYHLDSDRVRSFIGDLELDLEEVAAYLHTWELIANAREEGGEIARLDPPNRFRWLTNARSTIIQSSMVHVGRCSDPQQILDQLFVEYVL